MFDLQQVKEGMPFEFVTGGAAYFIGELRNGDIMVENEYGVPMTFTKEGISKYGEVRLAMSPKRFPIALRIPSPTVTDKRLGFLF